MSTVNVRISDQLNEQLGMISKTIGLPKSYVVRQAIQEHVKAIQEEWQDYKDVLEIESMNNPSSPIEDVIKRLGLEHVMENKNR